MHQPVRTAFLATATLAAGLVAAPLAGAQSAQDALSVAALPADTGDAAESPEGPHREEARVQYRPRELGVGLLLPEVHFEDLAGAEHCLGGDSGSDCGGGHKATVVALRDVGCPLTRKQGPALARLAGEYAERGVRFVTLNVNPADADAEIAKANADLGLESVATRSEALAAALHPRTTTEVFVVDASRTLRFRGALDDQYGIGFTKPEATQHFLAAALDDVLADHPVRVAATTSPGCALDEWAGPAVAAVSADAAGDAAVPTWHGQVSRIVQDACLACHREGGVGPFALADYDEALGRKGALRYVLENDVMPPWHVKGGGPWTNDRQLADADRQTLLSWLDAGCPEGEAAEAPRPRVFPEGWQIGEPDLVIDNPEPYLVPAEGIVDYQYAWVQTPYDEDKWVEAIEVQPGANQVVHHVLVFIEEPRQPGEDGRRYNRRFQGGLFGYFAAYVPGQAAIVYPEGHAKKLPAGAWLKFQVHYTPNGEEVLDQSRIGLRFADGPPAVEVSTSAASTTKLSIPAGEDDYKVRTGIKFDKPATLAAFSPHMHLRGKAYRYELFYPDESREVLLDIPRYDFNWQTMYRLETPKEVPAGTMLVCSAWYDNSADNPANPAPEKEVYFGEQTWDEMMIGYFEWWPTP